MNSPFSPEQRAALEAKAAQLSEWGAQDLAAAVEALAAGEPGSLARFREELDRHGYHQAARVVGRICDKITGSLSRWREN